MIRDNGSLEARGGFPAEKTAADHQEMPSIYLSAPYIDGSDGKESACKAGDLGSIPGSGRSPGEGNGNPLSILAWETPWTGSLAGYSP